MAVSVNESTDGRQVLKVAVTTTPGLESAARISSSDPPRETTSHCEEAEVSSVGRVAGGSHLCGGSGDRYRADALSAINYAGASLKPIGHYALLPSIPADGVRLGRSSDSHLMLWNAATLRRAARLTRDGAAWRLTTSVDAGRVDDADSEPLRLTRRRYRFERGARWTEVESSTSRNFKSNGPTGPGGGDHSSCRGGAPLRGRRGHPCLCARAADGIGGRRAESCATSSRGARLLSQNRKEDIDTASGASVRVVRPASSAERLRGLRIRRAAGAPETIIGAPRRAALHRGRGRRRRMGGRVGAGAGHRAADGVAGATGADGAGPRRRRQRHGNRTAALAERLRDPNRPVVLSNSPSIDWHSNKTTRAVRTC